MRHILVGFAAFTRSELANLFQYRVMMFLYALWDVINPVIYLIVWSLVAGERQISGFSRDDFVMYYLVFMVVSHLALAIEVYTFGPLIERGQLSPRLLRPIHPWWHAAAVNVSYKLVNLIMLIPVWIGLFLVLRPAFPGDWITVALFLPALAAAILLSFLIGSLFAMLAFWTTRSFSFWQIWSSLLFLLGGQVAPVAVLPGFVRDLAIALPARYALGFPVEVVLGRLDAGELVMGFAIQAGWIAIAAVAFAAVWRSGIKRYSAVGA